MKAFLRRMRVLEVLRDRPEGVGVVEISHLVEGHWRTIYRDLELLQRAGHQMRSEYQGQNSLWFLEKECKTFGVTRHEHKNFCGRQKHKERRERRRNR